MAVLSVPGFAKENIHAAVPIRSLSKTLLISTMLALMEKQEYKDILYLDAKIEDFYPECHGGHLSSKTIKQLIMMDAGLDNRGILLHTKKYYEKTILRAPGNISKINNENNDF